ncbi:MAG: hypothetical protein H7A34_07865 [bacterium]|nr:hypothetical protein [bacterium]
MKIAVIYPPNPDQSLHLIRDEYVCRQVPSVPFPAMLAQLCAVMRSHFPSAEIRAIDASAENFTLEQCAESVNGCEFAFLFSTAQTIPFDVSLLLLINKKNPHTALFVINPLSAGLYAESILTQFTFCAGIITSGFLQAVPDITARYPDIQTVHSVYLYEKIPSGTILPTHAEYTMTLFRTWHTMPFRSTGIPSRFCKRRLQRSSYPVSACIPNTYFQSVTRIKELNTLPCPPRALLRNSRMQLKSGAFGELIFSIRISPKIRFGLKRYAI